MRDAANVDGGNVHPWTFASRAGGTTAARACVCDAANVDGGNGHPWTFVVIDARLAASPRAEPRRRVSNRVGLIQDQTKQVSRP